MKTSTKLIIAGTTIGVVVAGALIAKHFINVDRENLYETLFVDGEDFAVDWIQKYRRG